MHVPVYFAAHHGHEIFGIHSCRHPKICRDIIRGHTTLQQRVEFRSPGALSPTQKRVPCVLSVLNWVNFALECITLPSLLLCICGQEISESFPYKKAK